MGIVYVAAPLGLTAKEPGVDIWAWANANPGRRALSHATEATSSLSDLADDYLLNVSAKRERVNVR